MLEEVYEGEQYIGSIVLRAKTGIQSGASLGVQVVAIDDEERNRRRHEVMCAMARVGRKKKPMARIAEVYTVQVTA